MCGVDGDGGVTVTVWLAGVTGPLVTVGGYLLRRKSQKSFFPRILWFLGIIDWIYVRKVRLPCKPRLRIEPENRPDPPLGQKNNILK